MASTGWKKWVEKKKSKFLSYSILKITTSPSEEACTHLTELWKTYSWPRQQTFSDRLHLLEAQNSWRVHKKVKILKFECVTLILGRIWWGLLWVVFHQFKCDLFSWSMVTNVLWIRNLNFFPKCNQACVNWQTKTDLCFVQLLFCFLFLHPLLIQVFQLCGACWQICWWCAEKP